MSLCFNVTLYTMFQYHIVEYEDGESILKKIHYLAGVTAFKIPIKFPFLSWIFITISEA
jgi:hypothetical protein